MFLRSGLAVADPPAGEVVSGTQPPAHVSARLGRTTHPLLQARDDGPHRHPPGATRPSDGSRRSHTPPRPVETRPPCLGGSSSTLTAPRSCAAARASAGKVRSRSLLEEPGGQRHHLSQIQDLSPRDAGSRRSGPPGVRTRWRAARRRGHPSALALVGQPRYVRGLGDVEQRRPRGGAQGITARGTRPADAVQRLCGAALRRRRPVRVQVPVHQVFTVVRVRVRATMDTVAVCL